MKSVAFLLLVVTCVLFGAALNLSIFSITPGAGDLTGWIRMLRPQDMATMEQSLLGGIRLLWADGNPVLAGVLIMFCLIFPLFKFTVLWSEIFGVNSTQAIAARLCRITAPYAMVEVFVLALLVMVVKGLPGGSVIIVDSGACCFAGSVIISLIAAQILKAKQP